MTENSEHHSPVCPSSTLHIDGINAQSIPKQKPQSGLRNVLGTLTGSITRTLCALLGETHAEETSACVSPSKSAAALSRFMNEYEWPTRAVIRATRKQVIKELLKYAPRGKRPHLQVIIDL